MSMAAEAAIGPWRRFLDEELALRPGRLAAIARITICCTVTVVLWMLFRIPLPAYAAYIVFLVSGPEAATTLLTAVGGAVAATLAVILTLLLFMLDVSEPALRLPLMAGATFLGMFLSRVFAIGPIAFLTGFVLVITQTLVDDIPDPDTLTYFVMWLWLVVMVPALLVALVNLVFGQNPARLALTNVLRVIAAVEDALRRDDTSHLPGCLSTTASVAELRQRAELLDHPLRARRANDMALIGALDELARVAALLPPGVPAAVRWRLADACRSCEQALSGNAELSIESVFLPPQELESLDSNARPIILAAVATIDRLLGGIAQRAHPVEARPEKAEAKSLFVADAFSNPEYVRFALKATLATMLVYMLYSAVDWPGIRTCVVTCFFVALGSVGETVHKLTLRLSGAVAGGLLGTLSIVFVLPHLTDIGGLALLVAGVSFFCAWVSTSSELLAYAGMQMAFAFFIGVLQDYGPTEELTVLRDRVLGILLGNIAMTVVFAAIWPVSAVQAAQDATRKALAALAALLRSPAAGTRLAVAQTLHRARRLLTLGVFETAIVEDHAERRDRAQTSLKDLESLTSATFVVVNQPAEYEIDADWRRDTAAWFEAAAGSTAAAPPDDADVCGRLRALTSLAPASLRAALEAKVFLSCVMRSVIARAR